MKIISDLSKFIVTQQADLKTALELLNKNGAKVGFVVSSKGKLIGVFTDGDVRRSLLSNNNLTLESNIMEVVNPSPLALDDQSPSLEISEQLTTRISAVPLIDKSGHLTKIAFGSTPEKSQSLGSLFALAEDSCVIIAEIGNNHNGSVEFGKQLVDLAIESGADCCKFQMRSMAALYRESGENAAEDLGSEYTTELLKKNNLDPASLFELFDYCKQRNMVPLCTPWDEVSLGYLEEYGMTAYKVASADFTNIPFLEKLVRTNKFLICSTGMATEVEIQKVVNFLNSKGASFALLHCNSTYPAPFKDINLAYMSRLKDLAGCPVGYSGHERGIGVAVAAVALGARIVEKHFTTDRSLEGNDHKVSLLPDEFRMMVSEIRAVERAIGTDEPRGLSQGEMINRETLAKSLVASSSIAKGERIQRESIDVKSPGQGLQPLYLDELVGKVAVRDIKKGGYFYESDLSEIAVRARKFEFSRRFGIPVRFHDFETLGSMSNLDFVEFHLSFSDLEVNFQPRNTGSLGLSVHAPELFSGDHILDLSSRDDTYREKSLDNMRRVAEKVRELKEVFQVSHDVTLVVNAGGFSENGFLPPQEKIELYSNITESLQSVDLSGIEIAIQTMPPFPWHFGGQRYHNLFVCPNEIRSFCTMNPGVKICLDVSHSMMACNYYGWSLSDFVRTVSPYVSYLHIVDALGVDGEGVQIGKGDVDFNALGVLLDELLPTVPFIPEVWQGHKNDGEGFWFALDYLERHLS